MKNSLRPVLIGITVIFVLTTVIIFAVLLILKYYFADLKWFKDELPKFTEMCGYNAEAGNFLGKGEYMGDNIYELKGLPKSDYLFRKKGSVYGDAVESLLINKNVAEPILCYNVKSLEIIDTQNENETPIMIEDSYIIEEVIKPRKEGKAAITDPSLYKNKEPYRRVRFNFDLPCNLVWECDLFKNEDGSIHLIYFDIAQCNSFDYDVTVLLQTTID